MNTKTIRIIQITDSHLFKNHDGELLKVNTKNSLTGVVNHIRQHETNIDMVLATGDITQDHSPQAYQTFLDIAGDLAPIIRGLPGNHDTPTILGQVWGELATPIHDIGNWRIIMLDTMIPGSNAGFLADNQLELLKNAANETPEKHVLVALHHNPVPVGSKWLDTMMVSNGHQLFTLIEKLPNIKAMIWGHIHQEYHGTYNFGIQNLSELDQIYQSDSTVPDNTNNDINLNNNSKPRHLMLLGCPSTCVQFAPGGKGFGVDNIAPGYRWLNLHADGSIETDIVRVENIVISPDTNSSGY